MQQLEPYTLHNERVEPRPKTRSPTPEAGVVLRVRFIALPLGGRKVWRFPPVGRGGLGVHAPLSPHTWGEALIT